MSRYAFWSEFDSWCTRVDNLPLAAKNEYAIFVKVSWDDLQDQDCFRFFREAQRQNVSVRVWPLLSFEEHYWLSVFSADRFIQLVLTIVEKFEQEKIPIEWISFDLETPQYRLQKWGELAIGRKWFRLWQEMQAAVPADQLTEIKNKVRTLLFELQEKNIKCHAVALPFLLLDGSRRPWERLLGIPFHDLLWDEISVMAYRPEFERVLGRLPPRFVYEWAALLKKYPAASNSIDLGEVGVIEFPHHLVGITDPVDFKSDIRAVRAAGIDAINIYSWETVRQQSCPSEWTPEVSPLRPAWSLKVWFAFALLRGWSFLRSWIWPFF